MKVKNKVFVGISIVFLISIVNGCGVIVKNEKHDNSKKIEEYNDNSKIEQNREDYTFIDRSRSMNSNNKIDCKYSGFSGIWTIWILNVKEDSDVTINYDSKVNSGDCKLVLVKPETDIQNIVEGTGQGNKSTRLTKGEYRIKSVGKNAEGEINLSINENENIETTKADED